MTNSFAHLGEAKMILLIGSNITEAHPVAGTLVKRAVRNGCRLIVVDPRRTDIAKEAETHLQLRVGSDIALLNAIMHVLIRDDLYDKHFVARHTVGFEELRRNVADCTPERAAPICGIAPEIIERTAHDLSSVKPALLANTLGITEHT
jgi:formate dehydrogenase major subunit